MKKKYILTHASDSTAKKTAKNKIGKFQVSGGLVNKEQFLPLPTIPVAGEKHEEVADQVAQGTEYKMSWFQNYCYSPQVAHKDREKMTIWSHFHRAGNRKPYTILIPRLL